MWVFPFNTVERPWGSIARFAGKEEDAMKFSREEKGQGMVEYALIIVLVAVVLIVVLALVGTQISNVFSRIISGLGAG